MNKQQYHEMLLDLKEHPDNTNEILEKYRKMYKNIYPFGDGTFKEIWANKHKKERTIKFLNAMLSLQGRDIITDFTLEVQENHGKFHKKGSVFDIVGKTQDGRTVLVEVQQNDNVLFEKRILFYAGKTISKLLNKGDNYDFAKVYILSLLVETHFKEEPDTYFHITQFARNRTYFYNDVEIFFVEVEKFFEIDDRTPFENRERSDRATMLRIFRTIIEDGNSKVDFQKFIDKDFLKDVSLEEFSKDILMQETKLMTDIEYEKRGAYLSGREEGRAEGEVYGLLKGKCEIAKAMILEKFPISVIAKVSGLTELEIKSL